MEKHVGLVVAEATNWILTVVGVRERADDQVRQSIQVEHFFEVPDPVSRQIELAQAK